MAHSSTASPLRHRWPRTRVTCWHVLLHVLLILALVVIMAKADTARPRAHWVPTIIGTSTDTSAVIGCRSNLTVTFSSPLPPGVALHRLVQCPQPHDVGATADGRTLHIIPRDIWKTGLLTVTITASAITGDSADDVTCHAVIPAQRGLRFQLRGCGAETTDIGEVLRRRKISTEHADTIIAPDAVQGMRLFLHAILEGPARIEGQRIITQATCAQGDILVDAELRAVPSCHIVVDTAVTDTVEVSTPDGTLLGAASGGNTVLVDAIIRNLRISIPVQCRRGIVFNGIETGQPDIVIQPTTDTVTITTAAPPPSVLFTLKGAVAPADGGDAPPDAVEFPDGALFTGHMASEKEFRVTAGECWIITAITTERGTEYFEPGITAMTIREHMRAPMHTVVILVAPRWVTFTVTRHLLAQQQGGISVLPYPPGVQAAVRLERRMEVPGGFLWNALSASKCGPADRPGALTWRLRCGDDVRLVLEEAQHQGLWLRMLDDGENVLPCTGTTLWTGRVRARQRSAECQQTDDGAHVVKVYWYQDMRVVRVGLSVRIMDGNRGTAVFRRRWFEIDDLHQRDADEPLGGRQIEYEPGLGATVDVEYSHPIDSHSLDGCLVARSFHGFHPRGESWARNVEIVARPDSRLTLGENNGVAPQTLRFALHDPQTTPRRQSLPMSTIVMSTRVGLRSIHGEPCTVQHLLLDRMEYPAALLRVSIHPTEQRREHIVHGERRGMEATDRRFRGILVTTATEEASADAVFEYAWLDRADELVVDVTTDMVSNQVVVNAESLRRPQQLHYATPTPWMLTLRPLLRRAILE